MKNKITNIAGILGLIGLAYYIYTNGGIDVNGFLLLFGSLFSLASFRKNTGGELPTKDPDEDA